MKLKNVASVGIFLVGFASFWWAVFSTINKTENQLLEQLWLVKAEQTKLSITTSNLELIADHIINKKRKEIQE